MVDMTTADGFLLYVGQVVHLSYPTKTVECTVRHVGTLRCRVDANTGRRHEQWVPPGRLYYSKQAAQAAMITRHET